MKLLINTSNLKKGGAIQVAHSFLNEIKTNAKHDFHVVLSLIISKQITTAEYPSNFKFYEYTHKQKFISIVNGRDKFLDKLESELSPDCVLSIFGTAGWRPKAPHIMGIANGWWYYPDSPAWNKLSLIDKCSKKIAHKIRKKQAKKEASHIVVETNDAKQRVNKYLNIPLDNISVVSNTYNQVFDNINGMFNNNNDNKCDTFKLITVSEYYTHKNLEFIQAIASRLTKNDNIIFYVTLRDEVFNSLFTDTSNIRNLGHIKIERLPDIYSQIDAAFIPTLMETFSASYPEAMKMGKPILTSDLSFAHDICGDAALYFTPSDIDDTLDKIKTLINSHSLQNKLKLNGFAQLSKFETSASRAQKYLEICESIIKKLS